MKKIKITKTGCFQDGAAYPVFQKGEVLDLGDEMADRVVSQEHGVELKQDAPKVTVMPNPVYSAEVVIENPKMLHKLKDKALGSEKNKDGI